METQKWIALPMNHMSQPIIVDECRDILRPEKLGGNEAWRPETLKTNLVPWSSSRWEVTELRVCQKHLGVPLYPEMMPPLINALADKHFQIKGIDKPNMKPWHNFRKDHRQLLVCKQAGAGVRQTCIWILALKSCVISSELPNSTEFQFPHTLIGDSYSIYLTWVWGKLNKSLCVKSWDIVNAIVVIKPMAYEPRENMRL